MAFRFEAANKFTQVIWQSVGADRRLVEDEASCKSPILSHYQDGSGRRTAIFRDDVQRFIEQKAASLKLYSERG